MQPSSLPDLQFPRSAYRVSTKAGGQRQTCHRWLLECFFRELLPSAALPCPLCPRVLAFGSISERFFSSLVSGLVLALWHQCCRCWGTWTLFISSVSMKKVIACEEERGIQWAQPSVLFTYFINEWIVTTTPWRAWRPLIALNLDRKRKKNGADLKIKKKNSVNMD